MRNIFTFLIIVVLFTLSENSFAQTNNVNQIPSERKLINGVNVAPKNTNLEKADPTSIIVNESNNAVIPDKPKKTTKKEKKSKYGIKKDEE